MPVPASHWGPLLFLAQINRLFHWAVEAWASSNAVGGGSVDEDEGAAASAVLPDVVVEAGICKVDEDTVAPEVEGSDGWMEVEGWVWFEIEVSLVEAESLDFDFAFA